MTTKRISATALALVFLLLGAIAGCGEDEGPSTPPAEEWCDLDRPREDCYLDENVLVNNDDVEAARVLCETPCLGVKDVGFYSSDQEIVKALKGFQHIGALSIVAADETVEDLRFLESLESAGIVEINGTRGLRSLKGLENLRTIKPPEGVQPEGIQLEITENAKLTSISALENLEEVNAVAISENGALTEIDGPPRVEPRKVRIRNNRSLKAIRGFDSMVETGTIEIVGNFSLTEIEGFTNLKSIFSLTVSNNRLLDGCEVSRLLDQLDEPPTFMTTIENNASTCSE